MKKLIPALALLPLMTFTSCDPESLPDALKPVTVHVRLNYETEMTKWHWEFDGANLSEKELGETYDNSLSGGQMRYLVRVYPIIGGLDTKSFTLGDLYHECTYTKDIAAGYNHDVELNLLPGEYNIMVWSDMVENEGDVPYYDASNFAGIKLQGQHAANTDYRDAFRGVSSVTLVAEPKVDTVDVTMQRPLAKYEVITTDLKEFIKRESEYLPEVDLDSYKVKFLYTGFMPNTYNLHSDKAVDAVQGVLFESKLNAISEQEASIGFDYVFSGDKSSSVSVKVGIYDAQDKQISVSKSIEMPLFRSRHTVLRGSFLMNDASGGIMVDPDFDGKHDVII